MFRYVETLLPLSIRVYFTETRLHDFAKQSRLARKLLRRLKIQEKFETLRKCSSLPREESSRVSLNIHEILDV